MDSFLCHLCRASIASGSVTLVIKHEGQYFIAHWIAKTCRQPEKYVLSFIDGLDASCLSFTSQKHSRGIQQRTKSSGPFSNVKFKVRLIGWRCQHNTDVPGEISSPKSLGTRLHNDQCHQFTVQFPTLVQCSQEGDCQSGWSSEHD